MDEDNQYYPQHGHITSLSVLQTHRKPGIATTLVRQSQQQMSIVFAESEYVSLQVQKSNRAVFHLYSITLNYSINDGEKGYYADGEDAYDMTAAAAAAAAAIENGQQQQAVVERPTAKLSKLQVTVKSR